MSLNPSNFEQAEYVDAPVPMMAAPIEPENSGAFIKAIGGGLVGLVIGAVVYALFVGITKIEIGYLAILVGFLVAKGMNMASGNRGGRKYQVVAILLTYLSVGLSVSLLVGWDYVHGAGLSLFRVIWLGIVAVAFPYFELAGGNVGSGLIGLFILFIGMRAAWRMTSGIPGEANHPFRR